MPLSTRTLDLEQLLSSSADLPTLKLKTLPSSPSLSQRFLVLEEIHEDKRLAYQQSLANVYAGIAQRFNWRFAYLVDGTPNGIKLTFGLLAADDDYAAAKDLQALLEGQLPGITFSDDRKHAHPPIPGAEYPHTAVVLGVPTLPSSETPQDETDFQGLHRIVSTMYASGREARASSRWQIWVVAEPLRREEVSSIFEAALEQASQLATLARTNFQASTNVSDQHSLAGSTSVADGSSESGSKTRGKSESGTEGHGTNSDNSSKSSSKTVSTNENSDRTTGTSRTETVSETETASRSEGGSLSLSQELTNKRAQILLEHVEKQLLPRLQKGLARGLFRTAVYLRAEHKAPFERLADTVIATWQGSQPTLTPLRLYRLNEAAAFTPDLPRCEDKVEDDWLLFHSMARQDCQAMGTLLHPEELALLAGLPQRELPGVRRRKTVDFAVHLPTVPDERAMVLGSVKDHGRTLAFQRAALDRTELNKHVFVTGVTGAGKTTTCLGLLLESDLPFLIIEPAKTEYRELLHHLNAEEIDLYRPGDDRYHSFRLNPFAFVREGQNVKSHASFIKNALAAVFPMEASMPMMVEAAILEAYRQRGWDVESNEFVDGNPFDPDNHAWPTFDDMVRALDRLLPTYGLGKEFEEKYRGSLVSRLRNLVEGPLSGVLNVPQSLDVETMLNRKVIIELEAIQGGEDKALTMAFLLGIVNEAVRRKYLRQPHFRHLTLVEEAHRLLARPEPGDRSAAMAVQAFADMLAEVRKYGEGLIIADQIPAKLIPDVIKNTHVKIVHRLFAEDDRRTMGEAMMMNDDQRNFLPNLGVGEAIVFCGGWHASAHVAIERTADTDRHRGLEDPLEQRSIQQLWRQRERFYPQLVKSAPWIDTADHHAQFVLDTSKALRWLTQFLRTGASPKRDRYFAALRRWLNAWHGYSGGSEPLASACAAYLVDTGVKYGREHTQPPPQPDQCGLPYLQAALAHVLEQLRLALEAEDFHQACVSSRPSQWDDLRKQIDKYWM
ncbi:hypothetical protein LRB11_13230 [Ectothiorhodospira haloalkaliphila]|uniref:ATP-binding protein n=1 Tax=Ectothiorhodospira haloalkaliphila TaxID=421628 RepID=UPI001EE8E0A8|nr:hypothetical protein [Ectothiorhodospira haloalkaliphila]MCG5525884.1 hypothetical protein [Ectothiorhodospira haloalkaliphila]